MCLSFQAVNYNDLCKINPNYCLIKQVTLLFGLSNEVHHVFFSKNPVRHEFNLLYKCNKQDVAFSYT